MTARLRSFVSIALLALLVACGDEQTSPADDAEEAGPEADEVTASATRGCDDVFEGSGLDQEDDELRESDLREALDAIPAMRHLSSAFGAVDDGTDLTAGDLTFLAPTSQAFNAASEPVEDDGDTDGPDDVDDYTELPAQTVLDAHVHEGGALSSTELIDAGTIAMADGTEVEVTSDGELMVERDGLAASVVCGDIEVDGATLHVIDEVLFDADQRDAPERELDDEPDVTDDEGIRPDIDEQLDEELDDTGGQGTTTDDPDGATTDGDATGTDG